MNIIFFTIIYFDTQFVPDLVGGLAFLVSSSFFEMSLLSVATSYSRCFCTLLCLSPGSTDQLTLKMFTYGANPPVGDQSPLATTMLRGSLLTRLGLQHPTALALVWDLPHPSLSATAALCWAAGCPLTPLGPLTPQVIGPRHGKSHPAWTRSLSPPTLGCPLPPSGVGTHPAQPDLGFWSEYSRRQEGRPSAG